MGKKEKLTEIELKLRRRHPNGFFRVGTHRVVHGFQKFELNEKEMKELESKGCKHWLISKEDFEKEQKAKQAKKKAAAKKPAAE